MDRSDPPAINFHCDRPLQQTHGNNQPVVPPRVFNDAFQAIKGSAFDPDPFTNISAAVGVPISVLLARTLMQWERDE